jgi:hypothetical protein
LFAKVSPDAIPTRLADLVTQAVGSDGERLLQILSHGYRALAEYDLDLIVRRSSMILFCASTFNGILEYCRELCLLQMPVLTRLDLKVGCPK